MPCRFVEKSSCIMIEPATIQSLSIASPEHRSSHAAPFRFTWLEFSGSLGDLGTFLPLVLAMSVTCQMDFGMILIWAGLMNVATGLLFRQPIPVQPMKAIAAIAITEGLTGGAIAAAGLWMGAIILVLALAGVVEWLARYTPGSVVRGLQVGIGAKLAWQGLIWIGGLPLLGGDSWLTALIVGLVVFWLTRRKQPGLLLAFAAGFVLLYAVQPSAFTGMRFKLPELSIHWPQPSAWSAGLFAVALPQLPLTLLNSVLAVCALSEFYFPGQGITSRKMAVSIGLMNLVSVPFGGVPMCHGAGGLAAQYRFGARTGASVIMLGILKIIVGALFGGVLVVLLSQYPRAILGLMLAAAGVALASPGKEYLRHREWFIALTTAVVTIFVSAVAGVLVGCFVLAAARRVNGWRECTSRSWQAQNVADSAAIKLAPSSAASV